VLSGPYSGGIVRPLDDGVYLSSAGNFCLAVLAYGGSSHVNAASYAFDNGVRPPPRSGGPRAPEAGRAPIANYSSASPPKSGAGPAP
jgi:hypothetical protein